MMCALTSVIVFFDRQLGGIIEFTMYWILTFPTLVYTARHGMRLGAIAAVCMLLLSLLLATPTMLFYLACCCAAGILYGGGVRRKWKNGVLLLLCGGISFFAWLLSSLLLVSLFGYDPKEDVELLCMLCQRLQIEIVFPTSIGALLTVSVCILMSILQTICIHFGAHLLLRRLRIELRPMKPLTAFFLPRSCGIGIIIIWVLYFMQNVIKLNQDIFMLVVLCYGVSRILAAVDGVLLLGMWLHAMHRNKMWMVFIVLGICFSWSQWLLALVGIVDMLGDVRRHIRKRGVSYGSIRKS